MTETKPLSRCELVRQVREESGKSERTEVLIDYIEELWETIDLLRKRFGEVRTQEIINASTPFPYFPGEL